jgi:hypothetical protein
MATTDLPEPEPLPGFLRLHHGTDLNGAQDIMSTGLNQAQAAAFNVSGEFWATTDVADADVFATVNPAGGVPARYSFDLPEQVLLLLLRSAPPRAYQASTQEYEFLPASFPILNRHMTNRQIVSPVP